MTDPKQTPPPGTDTDPPRGPDEAEDLAPPDEGADAGEKAKEWGERRETGKSIARGGKNHGHAPGVPDPEAEDREAGG